MDLSLLTTSTVITFMLILTRVSGMLVSGPMFNLNGIPQMTKVGMAFAFAFIFFPLYAGFNGYSAPMDLPQLVWMAFQEFIIGLLVGFVAEMLFIAFRMAGEYLAVQMGLSSSAVLDPVSGVQTPVLGQLYFIIAIWFFLSLNVHHALIIGMDKSFYWIPLGQGITEVGLLAQRFIALGSDLFVVALLTGLPVMGILLTLEVALSFVAKVMPQMNIFMVALPLKAAVGLAVLMASIPFMPKFLKTHFAQMVQHLFGIFNGMSQGFSSAVVGG